MRIKRTVVASGLVLGLTAGAGAAVWAAAASPSAQTVQDTAAQRGAGHRARATLNRRPVVKIGRAFALSGTFTPASGAKKGTVYSALLYVKGENGKYAPLTGIDGTSRTPHELIATVTKAGTFVIKVPASFVRHSPGTETFLVAVQIPRRTRPVAWSNTLVVTFVR